MKFYKVITIWLKMVHFENNSATIVKNILAIVVSQPVGRIC